MSSVYKNELLNIKKYLNEKRFAFKEIMQIEKGPIVVSQLTLRDDTNLRINPKQNAIIKHMPYLINTNFWALFLKT
jgi:hypothetical protein